jgi:CBS domain-containing protein
MKEKKRIEIKKLPKEVIKEIIAADVMTKNVITVKTKDPLSYVVRLFAEKNISGAPVLRGDNFVGVISESDIIRLLSVRDLLSIESMGLKRLSEIKVEEAMHKNPVFVYEYSKLSEVVDLMNKYDITRVPVLNEKRDIVGIITRTDMIRGISKELLFRILKKKPREIERLRLKIETDIDELLKIVEKKGSISVSEIKEKLILPEEKIEEWGKILEKHNLVEVFYPPIGKPRLRKMIK